MTTRLTTTACALAMFASAPVVQAQEDPKARLAALEAAVQADELAYRGKLSALSQTPEYRAALEARDGERLAELRKTVPAVDYATHAVAFAAAAEELSGSDDAVGFLVWLVQHARNVPERAETALSTLFERHGDSQGLAALVENNPYGLTSRSGLPVERAEAALDALVRSPHETIQAHALYARAMHVQRNREATAEAKERAAADLKAARALATGTLLAARIDAPEFARTRLQIGMQVPEIEGEDLDGVAFKLSDYRGKVVVLDFWGDW